MTTEILGLPEIIEAQASKYITHNEALRRIEALSVHVASRSAAEPASPAEGDVYIVPAGATGTTWTGHDDEVAHFYGGAWKFYAGLPEGLTLWVIDEAVNVTWDGTAWTLGGVVTQWTGLSDTPSAYTGAAGQHVRVNTAEDGLEFDAPGATLPTITSGDAGKILQTRTDETGYDLVPFPAGRRNVLINGGFDVWQRGVSFTASGYTADRWNSSVGSGGAATISQQVFTPGQTDVPGEPEFYFRHDRTTAATSFNAPAFHKVEGVRTFNGQTVTLSFYAKADAAKTFDIEFLQQFGSGGTPSADVTTLVGSVSLTTSWQRFTVTGEVPSIAGKTLGDNGDDSVAVVIRESANFSTFTLDLAQVQHEAGSIATPFDRRPIAEEEALCKRYYEHSYSVGSYPGDNVFAGVFVLFAPSTVYAGDALLRVPFQQPKRSQPAITIYRKNGSLTGSLQRVDASSTYWDGFSARTASITGFTIKTTDSTPPTADTYWMGHYTADSEL